MKVVSLVHPLSPERSLRGPSAPPQDRLLKEPEPTDLHCEPSPENPYARNPQTPPDRH
jgi:hypothetical protein